MVLISKPLRILTRHSIPTGGADYFLGRNPFEPGKQEFKEWCLWNIGYQGMLAQTNQNWEWHIVCGEHLKKNSFLRKLSKDSRIKIHFIPEMGKLWKLADEVVGDGSSARLDDDDALGPLFVEKCFALDFDVISFTKGYYYGLNEEGLIKGAGKEVGGKVINILEHTEMNCSAGIARKSGNVFKLGNHTKIHLNNKVTYDSTPGMWMQLCSKWCVTTRRV